MLITRNGTTLNVSKGAFNALFKDKGWKATNKRVADRGEVSFMTPQPKTQAEPAGDVPFSNMYGDNEFEDNGGYTVVYEDMTVKQLIDFANDNEIDLDGKTKKSDIIRIIKRTLGEE